MAPDQPYIAALAGRFPLPCASESDQEMGEGGTGGGADTEGLGSRSPNLRLSDSTTQPVKQELEDTVMTGSDSNQTQAEGGEGGMTKTRTNGAEAVSVKEEEVATRTQVDPPVDPVLVKQGLSEQDSKESIGDVATNHGGSEIVGDTAASLVSLAGGAVSYLSTQSANDMSWVAHGLPPSSPESPNKRYGSSCSPLPSMMSKGSSPTTIRDGRHTTLPPINSIAEGSLSSIDVLADLATKQESPQQGSWINGTRTAFPQVQASIQISSSNRPPAAAPSPGLPTPVSSEGTPRPNRLNVQQRPHMTGANETYYSHQQPHYPPIKDASVSPRSGNSTTQPATPASDNANLFARNGFPAPGAEGRRVSNPSEFQYNSDQATLPGPSTGEAVSPVASGGIVPQQPEHHRQQQSPPAGAPRNAGPRGLTGPMVAGGFKCEYDGCKAPPFQTQYLLK